MIRGIKGKSTTHLQINKRKWLQNFIKVHHYKRQIVSSENQNIENRVLHFQQLLKLNQLQNEVKKQNCHSITTQICQNQPDPNIPHDYQNNNESEQSQIKRMNKMFAGIQVYDENQQEKQKQIKELQRNMIMQNFRFEEPGKIKRVQTAKVKPLHQRISRSTRGWRNIREIQRNCSNNKIIVPSHHQDTKFNTLKRTLLGLQQKAYTQYGIRFIKSPLEKQNECNEFYENKKSLQAKLRLIKTQDVNILNDKEVNIKDYVPQCLMRKTTYKPPISTKTGRPTVNKKTYVKIVY